MTSFPAYGEIWLAELNPTKGHEQSGKRPVLIISSDTFNSGPSDLVIILPLTSRIRSIPTRVSIEPPEGGIKSSSMILCDGIRSISRERLIQRWGKVSNITLVKINENIRFLLNLN